MWPRRTLEVTLQGIPRIPFPITHANTAPPEDITLQEAEELELIEVDTGPNPTHIKLTGEVPLGTEPQPPV